MSPSSAGRQRRSLPRSGSPSWGAFLFGQRAGAFGRTGRTFGDASGKIPTVAACGIPQKGSLPPGRARWRPVRSFGKKQGWRTGKERMAASPRARPCGRSRAVIAAGLRRWGCPPQVPVGSRPDRPPFGPVPWAPQDAHGGKASRPPGKERLFASGACHLRAFGLWKLVHRSTLRQRPGVPGNALRRIFRCLPVMGPGAAAGRVAGSGPVWKITTLLED